MSDSPEFPEGSFIMPSTTAWRGQFMCANPLCHSTDLHVDFQPYKNQLTISCNNCGNFARMNFAMGLEAVDGG